MGSDLFGGSPGSVPEPLSARSGAWHPSVEIRIPIEAIDAKRSKQLMLALAEGDWVDKESGASAVSAIAWLNHGGRGWPNDFPALRAKGDEAASRKWLQEHAESHRLQRIVPATPLKN